MCEKENRCRLFSQMKDLETARLRAELLHGVRTFFRSREFLECDTPLMSEKVIPEASIELFPARFSNPDGEDRELYLLPSPEYWLKMILKEFPGTNIFQLGKCFRNREQTGRHHNVEFTMLEWYRPEASYLDIEEDTRELIQTLCRQTDIMIPKFSRMSMEEAFKEFAAIDLAPLCIDDSGEELREAAEKNQIHTDREDSWNDLFQRLFISLVEPELPTDSPLFLYDFPAGITCLAAVKPGTPWRERWELYWKGVELANCYTEMTEPGAVKKLIENEAAEKNSTAAVKVAADTEYWKTFQPPYPESSGAALGFDRLVMLLSGKTDIRDIIYFPFSP